MFVEVADTWDRTHVQRQFVLATCRIITTICYALDTRRKRRESSSAIAAAQAGVRPAARSRSASLSKQSPLERPARDEPPV